MSGPGRARPLAPALALALALPWLGGCDGGDPLITRVSRAPVIQIVPGVSAPSAPVITVLRTKKVERPPPETQPEVLDEPPPMIPGAPPTPLNP